MHGKGMEITCNMYGNLSENVCITGGTADTMHGTCIGVYAACVYNACKMQAIAWTLKACGADFA